MPKDVDTVDLVDLVSFVDLVDFVNLVNLVDLVVLVGLVDLIHCSTRGGVNVRKLILQIHHFDSRSFCAIRRPIIAKYS